MCKVTTSFLCNHVLPHAIHQISDQIDVTEINIIFYGFLILSWSFFYFEHYSFQMHFMFCKCAFSTQENLLLFMWKNSHEPFLCIPNGDRYCLHICWYELRIPSG